MSKKLTQDYIVLKLRNDRIGTIKNINLWGNDFEDVSILQEMPSLEIISLSINKIRSLKPFANMKNLRELYLRKNMIGDIDELMYLTSCPNLKTLWLSENPIADTRNYRANVIRMLPGLTKLDDVIISDRERVSNENYAQPYPYLPQYKQPSYAQQADYQGNYANIQRHSLENDYSSKNYLSPYPNPNDARPSYDKQSNRNHLQYPQGDGHRKQLSHENENEYISKGYKDDYDLGRANNPPKDKYNLNSHYLNQQRESQYDSKPPQEVYSSRDNKLNANSINSRVSNVTNCLLMLLRELNTNELEYVKAEIDKKLNN